MHSSKCWCIVSLYNLYSNIFGSQNYLSSHVRNSRSRARKRLCQVILSDVKPNLVYADNGLFTYSFIKFYGNVFSRFLVATRGNAVNSHCEDSYYYSLLCTRQKITVICLSGPIVGNGHGTTETHWRDTNFRFFFTLLYHERKKWVAWFRLRSWKLQGGSKRVGTVNMSSV